MQDQEPLDDSAASLAYHGGNLDAARRCFPQAPAPWIDLSTGINANAYPLPALAPEIWTRLPEPALIARLETIAARAYGALDPRTVVAAPGTQALIQLMPRLLPARRVGVLGLTYGEHRLVFERSGAEVHTVEALDDLAEFDVAVIVNPNNPDGRLIAAPALGALAQGMAAKGGALIIDEAFMDVLAPGESLIPHLPPNGAIVLRSFGKAYGLAGVRLGFAIAPRPLAARLRLELGPWAVSGPAAAIGAQALADTAWLDAERVRLAIAGKRLDASLNAAGFTILGGCPLYRLAGHVRAQEWFDRLGRSGVLVRPFAARPDWLRFGLPLAPQDWRRVETALANRLI